MARPPTPVEQDCLKALYHLGATVRPVGPAEAAARLGASAPTAASAFERLATAGLVSREPGVGVRLTPTGLAEALRVVRRHRLAEVLLVRVLGLDWSEVSAEADALEHAISPRLEQAIAAHLGEPPECPHGHPIPTPDGAVEQRHLLPLGDAHEGQWLVIREVPDDEPERLRRWGTLGLIPGAVVHVVSARPAEGIISIQLGETIHVVGLKGLLGLLGEPVPSAREAH